MSDEKRDQYDVVPDRPPSLDKEGHRLFIIPASVTGFFRKRRSLFYSFLLFLFLVLPWTTFNGKQTILLDIANRRFIFFDTLFFSHDGPLIFFILALAAFGIIFLTSVLGRVWCGWACPQTVFIDFIYRRIEEWTEGGYIQRRKLHTTPLTLNKFLRKTAKWILFFLVSSHIAHSFTAYFVGAKNLINITLQNPHENWGLFLWVQIFTLILLLDFGWFREQFCLIMCPYGRFQSALMDENSLAVLYDKKRGEPRKAKGVSKEDQGDCINCLRCVNVCPTGIDIRNGLQMECIACTACIDACDEIMEKVNKPKGLIRYSSEAEMNGDKRTVFTLRNGVYTFLLFLLASGIALSLWSRQNLDVKIIRAIQDPYQFADQSQSLIINHFRMHVTNQTNRSIHIGTFAVQNEKVEVVSPGIEQEVKPGQSIWVHLFFKFPANISETGGVEIPWSLNFDMGEKAQKKGQLKLLAP